MTNNFSIIKHYSVRWSPGAKIYSAATHECFHLHTTYNAFHWRKEIHSDLFWSPSRACCGDQKMSRREGTLRHSAGSHKDTSCSQLVLLKNNNKWSKYLVLKKSGWSWFSHPPTLKKNKTKQQQQKTENKKHQQQQQKKKWTVKARDQDAAVHTKPKLQIHQAPKSK